MVPMLLKRFCGMLSLISMVFFSALAAAAQSTGTVSLEVAVVKPHPSSGTHNNFSFAKNRFELEDQPLLKLIAFAYALNPRQIAGASDWVSEVHWDMSGTTNLAEDATLPQEQELIRQLLGSSASD